MSALRAINLALRFVLELVTLGAIALWGAGSVDGPPRLLVAFVAPAVAAVAWGLFVSPKARIDRGPAVRVGVEVCLLASGVVALWASGRHAASAVLGALDVLHLAVYHLAEQTATSRPRRA